MITGKSLGRINPVVQGLTISAIALLAMLTLRGLFDKLEWYVVASAMFFYAAVSSIIGSFWTRSLPRYLLLSLVVFLGMGALLWFAAGKLSSQPLAEAKEIRSLFAVITIFYFLMNGLSVLYRAVMAYVKKM